MLDKTIQELNLEDDFLFARVMSDKEICRRVLETILGISIREVAEPATQRTIDVRFESKGVRLDVYVNDDKGTIYNVEMQRVKKKNLPKRMRYYQGSIDMDLISAGEDYEKLKKSFVIFICTFDMFGEGRHIYTFENTCKENPSLTLGDETTKIVLNTKGIKDDVDTELKIFLKYVENSTDDFAEHTESELVRQIHKKVKEVKQDEKWRAEYMTLFQRDRANIKLGAKILKLYMQGIEIAKIAEILQLKPDFVKNVIDEIKND